MSGTHEPTSHAVPGARAHARELVLLFVAALVLRLVAFFAHGCWEHASGMDAWSWGYEAACIGESLAEGEGYRGQWARTEPPWNGTPPVTGWLAPAYPALIAVLMRIGGGVTSETASYLLVLQCVLSAATCLLLWGLGGVVGGLRLARVAAWTLALLPYSIWNAAHTVWDTTAVALVLTLFAELLLRFGRGASTARVLGLGFLFGLFLLVNPALLSTLPVALVFVALDARGAGPRLRRVGLFGAAAFVACLPWCVRNAQVVGSFALRTNLGVELMVGNNDLADGYFQSRLHPSQNAEEYRRYVALGEVAYSSECKERAETWMRADPVRWAALTLHRARLYWFGDFPLDDPRREGAKRAARDPASWIKWGMHATIGALALAGCVLAWRRSAAAKALIAMLLLFPVPYYLTHVLERYRFPIEPLMVLAASACVLRVVDRVRRSRAAEPSP